MLATEFVPPDRYFTVSALMGRLRDPLKLPHPPNAVKDSGENGGGGGVGRGSGAAGNGNGGESEQEKKKRRIAMEKQQVRFDFGVGFSSC